MKLDEAVMCFTQKIRVFGGLPSSLAYSAVGLAYSAVGCEFNVNESTIYSILKEVSLNRDACKTRYVLIS